MKNMPRTALTVLVLCASPFAPAFAEGGADAPWYEKIQINGFGSASYSYNANKPGTRVNDFRVFDLDDRSFTLDVAELVVQHAVTEPRKAGFRVDITAGSTIPRVAASSGLFRDRTTGEASDVDLHQAFVTYIAPIGSGLRLDGGKFVTHVNYEVIEGYDGYNDHATRSFLFGYGAPFTHTGLRASYTFSPYFAATGMIVNGWDNVRDNNRGKSYGAQLAFTPAKSVSVLVNYIGGPERNDDDRHDRRLVDVVATFKVNDAVTLAANLARGTEDAGAADGSDGTFSGGALYIKAQISERWALALRGEVFDDPDLLRTGATESLSEFTLTPTYRLSDGLFVRIDLRRDRGETAVFTTDDVVGEDDDGDPVYGRKKSQVTVTLNAVYVF